MQPLYRILKPEKTICWVKSFLSRCRGLFCFTTTRFKVYAGLSDRLKICTYITFAKAYAAKTKLKRLEQLQRAFFCPNDSGSSCRISKNIFFTEHLWASAFACTNLIWLNPTINPFLTNFSILYSLKTPELGGTK